MKKYKTDSCIECTGSDYWFIDEDTGEVMYVEQNGDVHTSVMTCEDLFRDVAYGFMVEVTE